jgi:hypothetical protein
MDTETINEKEENEGTKEKLDCLGTKQLRGGRQVFIYK